MLFVHIDKFLPYVLPYAEKCPQLVARRAIRDTIIDMAQRAGTSTLRCSLETVAGQHTYEIDLPDGIEVDQLDTLTIDGKALKPINRDMLTSLYPNADWKSIPGEPQYFMSTDDPKVVTIVPAPTANGQKISCELRLRFSRYAKEFPETYYERYIETVTAGALVRILGIPSQAFSDLAMAAQWAQIYAANIGEIQLDTMRDFTKESGHVVFRNVL